tara:strand:+ start:762 stop:1331 length:570 start_codon:yes stop_codon:yes gene_type:complete
MECLQLPSSDHPASRLVVLSGCSGGGKSTLLDELARRGHASVPEPGRRIVAEELAGSGAALPWVDAEAFARRAMAMAQADIAAAAARSGWVFFDRGLVDAAAALAHLCGVPLAESLAAVRPYHDEVFLVPPWPEIYVQDDARQHGLAAAEAEYARLLLAYRALGYRVTVLPRVGVAERADIVLARLGAG